MAFTACSARKVAVALALAGCTPAPIAARMDTHPPAAPFSFADKAVVFIDGERRAENILFHRRFDQILPFQNTDLLNHPRIGPSGTVAPDVFQVSTGSGWLYSVVEPGEYALVMIQDATQVPPESYHFDLSKTPLRFSIHAGEMVDAGHIVFHNDDTDTCGPCAALISTRVAPHDDAARTAMVTMWQRKMPGLPAPLQVRLGGGRRVTGGDGQLSGRWPYPHQPVSRYSSSSKKNWSPSSS